MKYSLIYFDGRGRAELARLTMAVGKVNFEDKRLSFESWGSCHKADSQLGVLPILVVADKYKLSQSQSIVRFLARETGLAGKNSMEQATIDMILESVADLLTDFIKIVFEKDDSKKIELQSKFNTQTVVNTFGHLNTLANGKGFCVGTTLSVADLALYNISTQAELDLSPYPKIKDIVAKVAGNKRVADYVKQRKSTSF